MRWQMHVVESLKVRRGIVTGEIPQSRRETIKQRPMDLSLMHKTS